MRLLAAVLWREIIFLAILRRHLSAEPCLNCNNELTDVLQLLHIGSALV